MQKIKKELTTVDCNFPYREMQLHNMDTCITTSSLGFTELRIHDIQHIWCPHNFEQVPLCLICINYKFYDNCRNSRALIG